MNCPMHLAGETTGRRLATIETIWEIAPIPGADAIDRVRVRGWDVVVKKGEFEVGDYCVYFEVDSMLDVEDERFAFLAPRGVRTDASGRKGHVLKTARLRGQYSQGLVLPLHEFPELTRWTKAEVLAQAEDLAAWCETDQTEPPPRPYDDGQDVTKKLGIVKWDPPIPANLSGQIKGRRPGWIPKTDEERIQNLPAILDVVGAWVATEKLDGSSVTYYIDEERTFGACSRNLDLLETEGNTLWAVARRLKIEEAMRTHLGEHPDIGRFAIQGELFGEGIQGNPLKMKGQHYKVFSYIVDSVDVPRSFWPAWIEENAVPFYDLDFPLSVHMALDQVENLDSIMAPGRRAEGVVWRVIDTGMVSLDGRFIFPSFKVVSNKYLLKADR